MPRHAKFSEEIVISGISGAFPQSESVKELKENLFSKKYLISFPEEIREGFNPPIPFGCLKIINRFDNSFFSITSKTAEAMEPASRMILEKTFEAIVDAGYNPIEFKGTNTGVFVGACMGDTYDPRKDMDEVAAMTKFKTLLANRISYWLDINGPSYVVDTACSASFYALEHAYRAIQDGTCETAIVGGINICTDNYSAQSYRKGVILSSDSICRVFDEDANGFVRAEAVVSMLLQKKKNARRIHANLLHVKTNCDGFKNEGLGSPSAEGHIQLYRDFYQEIDVDPTSIKYFEAHGTGTKIGEVIEVGGIAKIFCNGRTEPLKIGSLKSNMGHCEGASGLCSIVKAIISYETGLIPPNINLKKLNPKIPALHNGMIEVVTEPIPSKDPISINSFGIGGANGHVLVAPNLKEKKSFETSSSDLPRLVVASGRTEEAVNVLLNDLEKYKHDAEYIALYYKIFAEDIGGHLHRGYTILHNEKETYKHQMRYSNEPRPLWFVFSGMGPQWLTMGKSLLSIPICAESIQRSHEILNTKGVDLRKIIIEDDPKIFDNILHIFIGITAIQIALVDLLKQIGVEPDGIIGHSAGELGCAYADGCLTAEQTLLSSYYRGVAVLESNLIRGAMLAVGEGYDVIKNMVPPEIEVACHNGLNSCTLSGPAENAEEFLKFLKEKNIFARVVNVGNIAFHSRYIASAGPKLNSILKKIIPEKKLRSQKWICTSALESEWNSETVKYSCPEYYTRNLLDTVLFEEGLKYIPENAITIEIAPHGLFNSILNRSLPPTVDNVSLMLRNNENNVVHLLNTLGRLYELGINPKLHNLYPPVEFPVSRGTPMISHLIKWQHDFKYGSSGGTAVRSGERNVLIDISKSDFQYLSGHFIDERIIFPATGYLVLVWETLAMMNSKNMDETPVVFEDVRFESITNLPKDGPVQFRIHVHRGTGNFEILNFGNLVVKGCVYMPQNPNDESVNNPPFNDELKSDILPLSSKDVYKELRLRGYQYKGEFKGLTYANLEGNFGKVSWSDNFITFMDSMFHLSILKKDTRELEVPSAIERIVINVKKHFEILETLDKEKPEFPLYFYENQNILCSGGVEIKCLKSYAVGRKKNMADSVLEKYQFVSYHCDTDQKIDWYSAMRLCIHIILEHISLKKVRCVEILNKELFVSQMVAKTLADLPVVQADISLLVNENHSLEEDELSGIQIMNGKLPANKSHMFVIASNILNNKDIIPEIMETLQEHGFIITREAIVENKEFENLGFDVCFSRIISKQKIFLLKEKSSLDQTRLVSLKITNSSYSWIKSLKKLLKSSKEKSSQKILLYAEKEPTSGILGFCNCLRNEINNPNLRCFFILDKHAPEFSIENEFYAKQLHKNLVYNIYKNGQWGSYRHMLIEPVSDTESMHAIGNIGIRGDLSTLAWFEGPIDPFKYSSTNQSLICTHYVALNFRDIILALGQISPSEMSFTNRLDQENILGYEFSGKDKNGERYMGVTSGGGISNFIPAFPHLLWKIPSHWSMEDGATIPIAYLTAITSLITCGGLKKGQSVLIHSGSGGVGQAALNICTYYECTIFTTVGTPEKVKFVRDTFPQIPESHIGNSRDTSFEKLIMEKTNNRGVDLVLNSLSEKKLLASVRCVATGGKFVEIGKMDFVKNNSLGMGSFLKGISFHSILLDNAMRSLDGESFKEEYWNIMTEFINKGIVKPLVRTVFHKDKLESAFRYMATGKHIGKVLIKIKDEDAETDTHLISERAYRPMLTKPRVLCKADKSYVIIGGLGGFGLELANWLILRGARNVVLNSRNGIKKGYQSYRRKFWKSNKVNVVISTDDVTTEGGTKRLLKTANAIGPVDGIFNLAVVLQDSPFEEQTEDSFRTAASPKEIATIHLDQLSRKMCPNLNYFVVFSSFTSGRGNLNQTNYGMTNSVMERICEARVADNLPALAVEWGAIGEVGIVADFTEVNMNFVIGGTLQQRVKSCLDVLNDFMKQPYPVVSSMVVAEKKFTDTDVVKVVANILGIKDLKTISLTWTFPELGLDSLTMVELKPILDIEFGRFFSPDEIKTLTFAKLDKMVEERKKTNKLLGEVSLVDMPVSYEKNILLPIIRVPSLKDNGSIEEISAADNPTIFFFPGSEGDSSKAKGIGVNLNFQVLSMQYYCDGFSDTFEKTAEYYASLITERLQSSQKFYIIGYSIGTVLAVETIRILEKQGRKGHVWLIDGSIAYFEARLGKKFSRADKDVELVAIKALWPNISLDNIDKKVFERLAETKDWEERKKYAVPLFSEIVGPQLSEIHIELVYKQQKCLSNYKCPEEKLITGATFIRSTNEFQNLETDYGWSKYFIRPIEIHQIRADHEEIVFEKRIANILSEVVGKI